MTDHQNLIAEFLERNGGTYDSRYREDLLNLLRALGCRIDLKQDEPDQFDVFMAKLLSEPSPPIG